MVSRFLVALSVLLRCTVALAAPDVVAAAEAGIEQDCRSGGGRPSPKPGFETTVDLNGDGQPDYIIDGSRMDCLGGMSFSCGASGACLAEIYMSGPGGYRLVFQDNVYGFVIDHSKQTPSLSVSWHGVHCNKTGAEGCTQALVWNGRQLVAAGTSAVPPPVARPPGPGGGVSWSMRYATGGAVAFVPGLDLVRELSVTCAQGRAFLAVVLQKAQPFSRAAVTVSAAGRRFDLQVNAGEAYPYIYLADITATDLPRALAQARDSITISMNGTPLGSVSATGSGSQLRSALAPCYRL